MDLIAIKNQIELLADEGDRIDFGSGVSGEIVRSIEMELGGWLPASYKLFLATYGWMGRGQTFISGATGTNIREGGGSVVFDTELHREESGLPVGLVVIQPHEDGAYCLDIARRNGDECEISNYEVGWSAAQPIAKNLNDWILNRFLESYS